MKTNFETNEQCALQMDAQDPLARFRDRFYLLADTIYMDGNSLGLMSKDSEETICRVMHEWKTQAIGGWLEGKPAWFYLAETLGAQAAQLVGAQENEVVCSGTTTVNLHSLLSTFYHPQGKRTKILADELNFPSDIYALKGQIKLKGLSVEDNLILVPGQKENGQLLDENDIIAAMTDEIAVALFPSVLYRSGQLLDMALLTRKAHEKGIIIGFDCCHSVGGVPHYFDQWNVDFAFWCSYKYMNGGPGSPAFLYMNKKHFPKEPLLAGWFGCVKEKQFDMSLDFEYTRGAGGWQISSPSSLSAAAVQGALKIVLEAGIEPIRAKSIRMTEYLIYLIDHVLPPEKYNLTIATPRDPERRSGHVAVQGNGNIWRIHQALKAGGIIPDFRPPNIIRFAPIALYNTYHEIWQTVNRLKEIIDHKEYESFPSERSAIT
ncbi:MAG TPA: kynureninase [Candidatus Deferrimicrobium sp.]|nr:kynureninase [Candidatus Deferrimicrobium sp.]